MAGQYGRVRSSRRTFAASCALTMLAWLAGACGKGLFSSSSSSSGGGSSGTARSVYVANFSNGLITSLNLTAGALTSPVTISGGSNNGPTGLAVTPSKTALYAANANDALIYEFTLSSNGNLSTLASIATGSNPQQPVVTPSGKYAYSINAGGSLSEYTVNATTGELSANSTASTTSGLVAPISGVASNSYLYVTDQNGGTGVVLTFKINADGTLAAGPKSTPSLGVLGGLATPNQIIIDPTNTWVFVSDAQAGVVSLFTINGNGLNFLKSYATAASTPNLAEAGLLYVPNGGQKYIYCADQAADSVSVFLFNPALQTLTLAGTSPISATLNTPTGLAYAGSFLYVTNNGNGSVTSFAISNGALSNPTNLSGFSVPESILITH